MADIVLTPAAAARITHIAERKGKAPKLRLSVDGGGCAGFQYKFELADGSDTDDMEIMFDNVGLVIDPVSLPFLDGVIVDYVDSVKGAAFEVRNPQAQSSCGCGTSFSF